MSNAVSFLRLFCSCLLLLAGSACSGLITGQEAGPAANTGEIEDETQVIEDSERMAAALGTRIDGSCESRFSMLIRFDAQVSCQEDAASIDSRSVDSGLVFSFDVSELDQLPATISVEASYCNDGTCESAPASIVVDEYEANGEARGSWSIQLTDGSFREGSFLSQHCSWEEILGPSPEAAVQVGDLNLAEIAAYQGVKVSLMEGGENTAESDLIANRDTLIRAYVEPTEAWQQREVLGRLTLARSGQTVATYEERKLVAASSVENSLASSFNFDVTAADMTAGTSYSVELLETTSCTPLVGVVSESRYPAQESEALAVQSTGTLRIRIVPVRYNANGGILPDTSEAQIQLYRQAFQALYPVETVELSVRDPMDTDLNLSAQGDGWGELLDEIANQRQADGVGSDLYYYGLVNPEETIDQYCAQGCVLGVGFVAGVNDAILRASLGIGYAGNTAVETMVHELGHNHGRQHAPCGGPAGVDPNYPYNNAEIGVWGYDSRNQTLLDPNAYVDFMSYCGPIWISDYTFEALAQRISSVNQALRFQSFQSYSWKSILLNGQGNLRWAADMNSNAAPSATAQWANVLDAAGNVVDQVEYYRYDFSHVPGAKILTAQPLPHWHAIEIPGAGILEYP